MVVCSGAVSTPLTSPILAVNPGVLIPGQSYTFTLTAFNAAGNASSSVAIRAAQIPSGGICSVSPDSGVSLVQNFTISCVNWAGQVQPLSYQFNYAVGSGASAPLGYEFCSLVVLTLNRQASPQSSVVVQLPSGVITLSVNIIDAAGATATFVLPAITVSPPAVSDPTAALQFVQSVINGQLQDANGAGNAAAVAQIITATSSVLNQFNTTSAGT